MKKFIQFFTLTLCVSSVFLRAEESKHSHMQKDESHLATAFPYGINPQFPAESSTYDIFVGASYTYWVPGQNEMIVAYSMGDATTLGEEGALIIPDFNGQSGFKVHLGLTTPYDGWSAYVDYTWFYNYPSEQAHTLPGTQVFSSRYNVTDYNTLGTRFINQFNRIDAYLDRHFFVGKYSTLRPWMGILGAWDYQYLLVNSVDSNSGNASSLYGEQHWWGVGPYAGLESTYFLCDWFGLYADLGASIMYTSHYVYELLGAVPFGEDTTYPMQVKNTLNDAEPMLEAGLGIYVDYSWDMFAVYAKVGWELQNYFYHNGFFPNNPLGNRGGYSMQGLTATLGVYF